MNVLTAFRPELRGSPQAREAVRYLLVKPPLPIAARASYGVLTSAAIGLMPVWARRHLRLPWLPVTERTQRSRIRRTFGQFVAVDGSLLSRTGVRSTYVESLDQPSTRLRSRTPRHQATGPVARALESG